MIELDPFLAEVGGIISRCQRQPLGAYSRSAMRAEVDVYGSADAANLLYCSGDFPSGQEHGDWITTLQSFQDAGTGLFEEETHHPLHATAHLTAALGLFDAKPAHALNGLRLYCDADEMEKFLDGLDWRWNPWGESHKGAGLYAALVLADEVDAAWQDRYFAWLCREADPNPALATRHVDAVAARCSSSRRTFHYQP
jgi:hypothetical protein